MNWPGGYYAYWNKSDGERQILHVITYMQYLKNKQLNKYLFRKTHRYRELVVYQWGEGIGEQQVRGRG